MKKKLQYLVILLLMLCNILMVKNYYSISEKYSDLGKRSKKEREMGQYKLNIFHKLAGWQWATEGEKILPNITLKAFPNEYFSLRQVIGIGPKLVFRYTENMCQLCVDQEIDFLKELSLEIGPENIVVLASYRNLKFLKNAKAFSDYHIKPFNIKPNAMANMLEKVDNPYLFVTDESLEMKMIYVPEKNIPSMSQKYYEIIKKKVFNSN